MIVLAPRTTRPCSKVVLPRLEDLLEVDPVVLPERIVFGDEHRTFELLRDAVVRHPPVLAPRGLPRGARFALAQVHERRVRRIGVLKHAYVGKRDVDIREDGKGGGRDASGRAAHAAHVGVIIGYPDTTILIRSPGFGGWLTS